MYKIALLLKKHYYSHIDETLKANLEDVDLQLFSYNTLYELNETFRKIKKDFDGFLVSGLIPMQSLIVSGEADKDTLIEICSIDIENTYRILLQQLVTSKDLQLSRIGMDFLRDEHTLEDLIRTEQFAQRVHIYEERWKTFTTLEELVEEEDAIIEMYVRLYKNEKIDLIITYFYSVVENLKEYGIDCYYVYPSNDMLIRLIENLKKSISLRTFHNNLSAVIHIDTEEMHKLDNAAYERYQLELNRIVMEFNQQNFNKMILKKNYNDVELYTDYMVLKKITSDFEECHLWKRLNQDLGFTGSVGYGVGKGLYQARINAMDACHYGRNGGPGSGGSFLIDEKEILTVLDIDKCGGAFKVSEDYVNEVSNKVKLSPETIVRIIGIMDTLKTDEISSQELVSHLNISLRSANKFLSVLEGRGYAEIIRQKRNGNKGRPINVYKLLLDFQTK